MLSGRSWSGNERNCCFLNLGNDRFCEMAPAAGLDFLQDGRAVALVDWDHDGQLDLWITNRNSPRVRFIHNEMRNVNHFLEVRLTGAKCNRDAIGARLELHLAGTSHRTLYKSLRAGEGFLSQSSKWAHFGLGTSDRIEKLVVRWPDGDVTEYRSLPCDRRFTIVQGAQPREWMPPRAKLKLAASNPVLPTPTDKARIVIVERKNVPPMQYESFDGWAIDFDRYREGPLLINVWATWCAPCVAELSDFRDHAESLRAAGLNIVAISVDGLRDGEKRNPAAVRSTYEKHRFPFEAGMAPEATVRLLERGPGLFLNRNAPLPIPSSFLFDKDGKIAVIYTGPVNSKQLLNDLKLLEATQGDLLQATVPFPGRWLDERRAKLVSTAEAENASGVESSRRLPLIAAVILGLVVFVVIVITVMKRKRRGLVTGDEPRFGRN
jgi:peroxiredoxin